MKSIPKAKGLPHSYNSKACSCSNVIQARPLVHVKSFPSSRLTSSAQLQCHQTFGLLSVHAKSGMLLLKSEQKLLPLAVNWNLSARTESSLIRL